MKLITRCAPGVLAVTIAMGGSVALATLASAQSAPPAPATPGAPPPRSSMPHGGPGMQGGPMKMELERLKGSLKLTAGQAALWDKAEAQMQPSGDPREAMRARRDRTAAMLDDPNFDPRKLAAEMDSGDAERRARTSSVRDAWFAVYDSLNPVQRGQAREFLRSHLSHRHGMHGERMGEMQRHDGDRPPMPPR